MCSLEYTRNCMIHVACELKSRATTISLLRTLSPGNLHLESTNAAIQVTNTLNTHITTVVNTELNMYLESGTVYSAATLNISEKFFPVGLST